MFGILWLDLAWKVREQPAREALLVCTPRSIFKLYPKLLYHLRIMPVNVLLVVLVCLFNTMDSIFDMITLSNLLAGFFFH